MNTDEVVVTKFDLSAKEQTLKSRFLSNQRPAPAVQTSKPQVYPPDPQLDAFLKDMQESMRQQPVGALAGELLKKQANMMQQQIDLLRENTTANQTLMQSLAKQASQDPKRAVAELMVPIMGQLKEISNLHRETKQTAEVLGLQLQQLKMEVESKSRAPEQARETIQNSMDKFAMKKALFQQKVTEAQKLVDEAVVQDGGISAATEGIKYLQSQIQQVNKDTQLLEQELLTRYQRIVEQAQRVKSLPQEVLYPVADFDTARERLLKRLGGVFDYNQFIVELDGMKGERNQLMLEFKRTAPDYPRLPRLQQGGGQMETRNPPKKTAQYPAPVKTVKPAPVPLVQTKRTFTKKPPSMADIITDPQNLPPPVSKVKTPRPKAKTPRPDLDKPSKPTMISQETQAEGTGVPRGGVSKQEDEISVDVEDRKPVEPPPAPKQPQPFQLADSAGTKKRIQPEDLLPTIYTPPTLPQRPVDTTAPPRANWEKQTVDIVTEYVLEQQLAVGGRPRKPNLGTMGRWLGPDQLESLIKEGIFVDAQTIERLGIEVLDEVVSKAKMDASLRKEAEKSGIVESEERYGSDFEKDEEEAEVISERSDHSEEKPVAARSPSRSASPLEKSYEHSISFSKLSPRKDLPSSGPHRRESESKAANDISALFSPALLSKMSPAAVQQYVTSLIESGHIGPRTDNVPQNPSISLPAALPPSQLVPAPTAEERKEPMREELDLLLGPDMAGMLMETLKNQREAMTQEMIERFKKSLGKGEQPLIEERKATQPAQPPIPSQTSLFKDAFSLPKRLNLDLDAEEAKLLAEQNMPRMVLKLPPFRPPEPVTDNGSNMSLYLSASESSVGGKSIGTDIFSLDNTEYMGSLAQFMHSMGNMEEGQVMGNPEVSEGELQMGDEGLSSGEIPPDVLAPSPVIDFPRPRVNVADILSSEEGLEASSEGEFDPHLLFRP